MGNCRGRLISSAHAKIVLSDIHSLATLDQTAGLHMVASDKCAPFVDEGAIGDLSSARSLGEQIPNYTSIRAATMMQSRSEFSSDVDHEIEHSKAHWSELRGHGDSKEGSDEEDVMQENVRVFIELTKNPQWTHIKFGPFFRGCVLSQEVGQKIAEGGQAEIFECLDDDGNVRDDVLLKVFKKGSRLSQLRQQWPSGVLQRETIQCVVEGFITEDGRFAFGMVECWGDLRKLIDQAMQAKHNQGPPFPFKWNGVTLHALHIMEGIAWNMRLLHKKCIVHRDMKASNILVWKKLSYPHVIVADFECSIGVVGTGFWRAPEILLSLKERGAINFSEKVDVYGYGMTCYEIVTGLLPFEGELEACPASYDLVIEGRRPKLPRYLDKRVEKLIRRCWDPFPIIDLFF